MGPKAIVIVLGVVTLTVGIIMGDVIVGVAGSEQVNTGSYLRAACGGDQYRDPISWTAEGECRI